MVQKYQALVYTVCHQLVPDVQEAQDLTQETFLAEWRAIDRCPPGFEKQWLARIAANKAKDYLRSAWVRKMNTPGDEVLALEGAPPGMQPEQQVLETLGEEELTGMILNLREPYCTPCRRRCGRPSCPQRSPVRSGLHSGCQGSGGCGSRLGAPHRRRFPVHPSLHLCQ